jgi:hypothetical protein
MKNPQPAQVPLPKQPEPVENKPGDRRQRLAELLGMLLARYWLKKQHQPSTVVPAADEAAGNEH